MKLSTQPLRDLLATRQFLSAPLFSFALVGGTVLRYCAGDVDLTISAVTYGAGGKTGPYFLRGKNYPKVTWKIGTEVSTVGFDVLPGTSTVAGLPFLGAVRRGIFDGAEFEYRRAYMAHGAPTTVVGTVLMFAGRVASVDPGRSKAVFECASHLELLSQNFPRNLYEPGCVNTLYDAPCGLTATSFSDAGTVASGSTPSTIITSGIAGAAGFYDLGKITFSTGANAGVARTIKSWNGSNTLKLIAQLPSAPGVGDAITVFAGCDKLKATCLSRFNNLANFRGFPTVPKAETGI